MPAVLILQPIVGLTKYKFLINGALAKYFAKVPFF
jgi:hypothetical protein